MAELSGCARFQKAGESFAPRDPCYWDDKRKFVTKKSEGNIYLGEANRAAAVADSTVEVSFKIECIWNGPIITMPPGWDAKPIKTPSVSLLELKELCYAATSMEQTAANVSVDKTTIARRLKHLREMLHCHRIDVMAWLMQNGVEIPAILLADETHPRVGAQQPDRATVATPHAS